MNTRKIGVVLLALLLAGMAMVPMVSAEEQLFGSSYPHQSDHATAVTTNEAAAIAELNVKDIALTVQDFAYWNESSVHLAKTYYDLNDQPTAYAFEVLVDGKYNGYILVSATTGNYPVLEATKGKIPGTDTAITRKSQNSASEFASENGLTVTDSKPVYLGRLSYYQKYSTTDKKGRKDLDVFVDERSGNLMKSDVKSPDETSPVSVADYNAIQARKKAGT